MFTIAGLAIAAGAAATAIKSSRNTAKAEADYPPLGEFVEVTGGKIHYVREGSGPEVILLHGAGGNVRDMTFDLMGRLSDRYAVTVFDRPGLGYSDRVPGIKTGAFAKDGDSPMAQAAMLREAAQKIGIEAPIIVGHSFGNIVGAAWALLGLDVDSPANTSGLVSLGGVLMPWEGPLGRFYQINGSRFGGAVAIPAMSAWVSSDYIKNVVEGIFTPQPVPDGYIDYVGATLSARPYYFRANVRQVVDLKPHVIEMSKRYSELDLPVEIVHGDQDTIVPLGTHATEFKRVMPTANINVLEGVGHMPHHADPDATVAAIDRAVSRAGLR